MPLNMHKRTGIKKGHKVKKELTAEQERSLIEDYESAEYKAREEREIAEMFKDGEWIREQEFLQRFIYEPKI